MKFEAGGRGIVGFKMLFGIGFFMARFPEAEARLFKDIWVCRTCKSKQRSAKGKPDKCRRCGSSTFRLKNKTSKKKSG